MKKILVSLFGCILLVTNVTLITAQNTHAEIKKDKIQEESKQNLVDSLKLFNNKINIKAFQSKTKKWNNKEIDDVMNNALRVDNNQLIIDKKNLDINKLPIELLTNLDLVMQNLNKVVNFGLIKVNVIDQNVKLNYANYNFKNSNKEIVYFSHINSDNKSLASTGSSSFWISVYGPSSWWKFWDWGAYLNIGVSGMVGVRSLSIIAKVINIIFLIKNINNIFNNFDKLKSIVSQGIKPQNEQVSSALFDFASSLGVELSTLQSLGNIDYIISLFFSVITFGVAMFLFPSLGIGQLIISLISNSAEIIFNKMLNVDRGQGIKWQFANFIIPWNMYHL